MGTQSDPVKLAVTGGRRGRSFERALSTMADTVRLTAVCDLDDAVRADWKARHPEILTLHRFEDLLASSEVDAVVISTPVQLHARQAIMALEAGKHVVSEVPAALSLEECWALVEAVEKTGLTYMMAENYCYMRPNMMLLNMVGQGLFGEIVHAEGAYIHDVRNLTVREDGSLTWRGERRRDEIGNIYPTHSLGPVAQWLGVNRPGGDRLESTATFSSASHSMVGYIKERFGAGHPGAAAAYWQQGDSTTTVITTERGCVVTLRFDALSPRPHNMTHYALQGSQASYLAARHREEDPLIWLAGRSPGSSPPDGQSGHARWESLWTYENEFEHPYWREWGETAREAGHGGGDFFIVRDFVQAIKAGTPPPIDVYDAVTWSSIIALSQESLRQGSAPVDVPDFARNRTFPAKALSA